MKQLKRLNLKSGQTLNADEMKKIHGGDIYTTPVPGTPGVGTCGLNYWKGSERVKAIRGLTKEEALAQYEALQHEADPWAFYDAIYWCCDSCD